MFLIAHIVTTSKALAPSSDALVPSSFLFLIAHIVTTSKALAPSSDALVPSSFLFLIAHIVTTSKALAPSSDALVPSSFLFLIAHIVTTSKALAPSSDALVPSSFLFLIAHIVTTSKALAPSSDALVPSSFLFLLNFTLPNFASKFVARALGHSDLVTRVSTTAPGASHMSPPKGSNKTSGSERGILWKEKSFQGVDRCVALRSCDEARLFFVCLQRVLFQHVPKLHLNKQRLGVS